MRRKLAEIVTGVAAALVVFVAVPAVLTALVGVPVPRPWNRQSVISGRGLFDLLAVVAWIAWAACCLPLLRSVTARVKDRDTATAPGAKLPEWLATRIAAAVLALGTLGASAATSASALPSRPASVATVSAGANPVAPTTSVTAPPGAPALTPAPSTALYTVMPGDSLWNIAQDLYGDGGDWMAIAAANVGQVMDDGTRFVDPSLLMPGWVLSVPDLDGAATAPPPAASAPVTEASVADAPTRRTRPVRHATDPVPVPAHVDRRRPRGAPPAGPPLPELVTLGLGVLAASALARRARRARHLAALRRPDGDPTAPAAEEAATAGSLLAPFEGAPVVDWLELANRHLGASLASAPSPPPSAARLVRVGPDGVEVRLREAAGDAPQGWELVGEGTWLLPSTSDVDTLSAAASGHDPWLPLLLAVGDNDQGSWLLPLSHGDCLPVLGPEADAMVAAMVATAQSWSWSECLVITSDPETADPLRTGGDDGRSPHRASVLFAGDPESLTDEGRTRAAVVTTLSHRAATDLTVVIDARAASLHPLGVTLRPNLLQGSIRRGVEQLLEEVGGSAGQASPERRPPRRRASPRVVTARAPVTVRQLNLDAVAAFGVSRPADGRAGTVDVRLLTAMPRLDGLAEELDPKRARRATELVAYLALHHPDPVTSDRLRNRVLGSADADAAAKTLFNTVGAARRALGVDPAGEPLLPPASKSGHYRLSALVTTDVDRAGELMAMAEEARDDDEAIALLRAALDLVESEPLAGVLTGYGWWGAEGHERRIAAALVDGACRMAQLAADRGFLDLARWGLERARLVEPYSEVLSRAAMRVAAVEGDAERLRREWVDCQRWVDELDPGGLPSEATERLYADLRRRVPVVAGSDTEA